MRTISIELSFMKQKEVFKLLQKGGWYVFKNNGKCSQFRHPLKLGIITILGEPGSRLAGNTLRNILDLAGI